MAGAKEQAWYDRHYEKIQQGPSPWYTAAFSLLRTTLQPSHRLLEVGCGQGALLRQLADRGLIRQSCIHGVDQSQVAVNLVRKALPQADLRVGDIYSLPYPSDGFDVCLMMETLEHLAEPDQGLREVNRVLKAGGTLYLSFPNYVHLPWLLVRLLAEQLNRPNWIVLQPIDRIYTVFAVRKLLTSAGFRFERALGSTYGPPLLYGLERGWMTQALNRLGLWWFSFHPVLVFRKL